ncbi:Txe/YoeB family addiction module toxin [Vibrio parahaemolyticus]|uniref:Txe/YoeB family addiction module toxin n=1 Tax=Vibrio parahaemolyticus TaxID=670 RepID=UPI00193E57EA|nr:Txe/YoeB family addiction module toxin [Vibrio parahaemolyticus]EHG1304052.1 Txe/YoeB family addiction module toxin [Vibrio parahaemolyticus]MBM5111753.1 Txe/YoeB family addiction module toxin [Vibrio parahaemolyticus]
MGWAVSYTKNATKGLKKLKAANLIDKAEKLIVKIAEDPYVKPPPCEKLVGDLKGLFSRRVNIQHRIVYEVNEKDREIIIHSTYSHYE